MVVVVLVVVVVSIAVVLGNAWWRWFRCSFVCSCKLLSVAGLTIRHQCLIESRPSTWSSSAMDLGGVKAAEGTSEGDALIVSLRSILTSRSTPDEGDDCVWGAPGPCTFMELDAYRRGPKRPCGMPCVRASMTKGHVCRCIDHCRNKWPEGAEPDECQPCGHSRHSPDEEQQPQTQQQHQPRIRINAGGCLSLPMPGRFCCICGRFARLPFAWCNHCGDTPSYHHGRCCPWRPPEESAGADATFLV